MSRQEAVKSSSRLVQIAAAIVVIWAMRFAKEVLIPIALAVLFAFLLAPLVHRLERAKVPRVVAVLLVVLLAFGVIGGIGTVVTYQVSDLTNHLPEYTTRIENGLNRLKGHGGFLSKIMQAESHMKEVATSQPASRPAATQKAGSNPGMGTVASVIRGDGNSSSGPDDHVQKVEVVSSTPPAMEMVSSTFGPVLSVLATGFVVVVLCIFMLLGREDLRDRVIRLVSHGHLNVTTQAMDDAAQRVSRYLSMQALTNGIYGCLVATGLLLLGVPNALLWGLLATVLRFIPYVGPWLAAAGPMLLAFVTHGGRRGFETLGMYVTLEIIVSSFVEPWLYGSKTGVSSIAILIAAVFWAWLWGGVGLLLATPLTVLLVVIGKYVPQLEFLSVLLGDEPVFNPPTRYYQRLLAADQEEATELIEQYLKEMPLEQVYESVMIPALGLAHRDRFRGRLDGERADFIRETMKEEIRELGERPPPPEPIIPAKTEDSSGGMPSQSSVEGNFAHGSAVEDREAKQRKHIAGAEKVQIVCLPARDEVDELAGMMFAQLLEKSGFKAEAVSASALASEMLELVGKMSADIVVISALPPSAVTHARYLCKRLHQLNPEIVIVVGLWTMHIDPQQAREKIACDGRVEIATTFSEGLQQVDQLVHPLILAKDNGEVAPHGENKEKRDAEKEKRVAEVNRNVDPSKVGAAAEKREEKPGTAVKT